MKLATVVVCYFPGDEVVTNIASYSSLSDLLYIWDNTPNGASLLSSIESAVILNYNHQNMGLPFAYNRAIEYAIKEGATHIMTMDQDSRFENFAHFHESIRLFPTSVVCPPINNKYQQDNIEVTYAAQSGCVFPITLFKETGLFREDFFIGMVDAEMQLRALEAGYKIVLIGGCNLVHHLGSGRKIQFGGHVFSLGDYSALRYYYDSRNRILMWKEFPNDYDTKGKIKHYIGRLKLICRIILFENKKLTKIRAIIRGTWNGVFNRIKPF